MKSIEDEEAANADETLREIVATAESSSAAERSVSDSMAKVNSAVGGLSILEFEVITALFPAKGLPESHEVLALRFGLTLAEVKEIEANALRNLRGTRFGLKRAGAPWN